MAEAGELSYIPRKKTTTPKIPQWKQTVDEISALRAKRQEAVRQELFARSKELLTSAGVLDAGIFLAQEIWKQTDTDTTDAAVRVEVGYDTKLHPSLIIRSGLEPVMVNKNQFIAWKSKGVRIDFDPGMRSCSIKQLVGGKELWREVDTATTAQYAMTPEARSLTINTIYQKIRRQLADSHSYFELGRAKDKTIQGPSEKRFQQIAIAGKNLGNFVQ